MRRDHDELSSRFEELADFTEEGLHGCWLLHEKGVGAQVAFANARLIGVA